MVNPGDSHRSSAARATSRRHRARTPLLLLLCAAVSGFQATCPDTLGDLDAKLGADLEVCDPATPPKNGGTGDQELCDELLEDDDSLAFQKGVIQLASWLLAWSLSIFDYTITQVPTLAEAPDLGDVRIVPGELYVARAESALVELKIWDPTGLPLDPANRPGIDVEWTVSDGVIQNTNAVPAVYLAPTVAGEALLQVRVTSGAQTRTDAIKVFVEEPVSAFLGGNTEDVLLMGPLAAGGDRSPRIVHLNVGLQTLGTMSDPPCTNDTVFALVGHGTPQSDLTGCVGGIAPRLTAYSRTQGVVAPSIPELATFPAAVCGLSPFPCPAFSHNVAGHHANAVSVSNDQIPPGAPAWSVAAFDAPQPRQIPVRLKYDVSDAWVAWKHGSFPETTEEHLEKWGARILEVTNAVLARSRSGLQLVVASHDTSRKDGDGNPAQGVFDPANVCFSASDLNSRVPDLDDAYLNVVFVEDVVDPWGSGYSCVHDPVDVAGRVLAVDLSAPDAGWVLAHELGHALSLDNLPSFGHVNGRFDLFDKGNTMALNFRPSITEQDFTFTLGQVFRMNVHPESWLQHSELPPGAVEPPAQVSSCQVLASDHTNSSLVTVYESGACPPLQLVPYDYPGYD